MKPAAHNPAAIGNEIHSLVQRLFPIHRSMTGDGVRETLSVLNRVTPVTIKEVASGTKAFDWIVPQEWNVRDAYIKDSSGKRIIDFKSSNLHLLNGSCPVDDTLTWSRLKPKLHTLPDQPEVIPYRTCFHRKDWGFCLTQHLYDQLDRFPDTEYEVCIDSAFKDGSLTYGEIVVPGSTEHEVLLSAHICHPSLANDNLSGLAIAAFTANELRKHPSLRHTYRIVMAPATIGAIAWLSQNQDTLHKIRHGLVLSLLGDGGYFTYKKSRRGGARIDRVTEQVMNDLGQRHEIRNFEPFGYDERQYCSPGINLPMGCLMRTPSGEFDEYHTSNDNLDFVKPEALGQSFVTLMEIVSRLENDQVYVNTKPNTEPRLDRFGLYEGFPANGDRQTAQRAIQWVLNLSDGNQSLRDIAETSGMPQSAINEAAEQLKKHGLLESY